MKTYLKSFIKTFSMVLISLFLIIWWFVAYAISFPTTPSWEVLWWKFMNYFNKILVDTWTTSDWTVRKSVDSSNSLKLNWKAEWALVVAKSSQSDSVPWTWVQNKPDLNDLNVNSITFNDWTSITSADWLWWGVTVLDANYEYRLVWTTTNSIACFNISESYIVSDEHCTKDLYWWTNSSQVCILLWWVIENTPNWTVCVFSEKIVSSSNCDAGILVRAIPNWKITSNYRRDNSWNCYKSAPECPLYTKYTTGTSTIASRFDYFGKSQTTATNYNVTYQSTIYSSYWCEISISHSYWDYKHSNITLTNMFGTCGSVSGSYICTTIPSILYYDYQKSRAAEHCVYQIPANPMYSLNLAYLNKVACN